MQDESAEGRESAAVIAGTPLLLSVALVLIGVIGGAYVTFRVAWRHDPLDALPAQPGGWAGAIALFLGGAIAHEALHLIGWKIAGRVAWSDLALARSRRKLGVIARLRVPIRARAYRFGLALPAPLPGAAPIIAGVIAGAPLVTLWGCVFLFESFSDLAILIAIHGVAGDAPLQEHPTQTGCTLASQQRVANRV